MNQCLWCGKSFKKLAKSHIIPKSFFAYDNEFDRFVIAKNQYKKRRRTGPYDRNILCNGCENAWSYIDSRASDILLKGFMDKSIPFYNQNDEKALQIERKYEQPLKEFLIYILWRGSVSNLPEFDCVELGPYADRIKEDLINQKQFSIDEYSFVGRYISEPAGHFLPSKRRFEETTYYTLDFANFIFDIKIDNRKSPPTLKILDEQEHLIFLKLEKTPDKRRGFMVDLVKEHAKNFS